MSYGYISQMLEYLTGAYAREDIYNMKHSLPLETNIGRLFGTFGWGLELIREHADRIRIWDDIDNARGAVLDRYGLNFGVKRISSDDRFYRLAIKVKMLALLSGGDTDTVIRAASELLDVDPTNISYEDVFPAKIALYVDFEILSQDRRDLIESIAYAIKRILVAGVGMRLYLRTYHTYRYDLTFLQCGYGFGGISAVPVSQDRKSIHEEGAGGVIYHTHIKSKKID